MKVKCSGKAHPNAGRKAVEDCSSELEIGDVTSPFTYLCRSCAPQDSKNGNTRFQKYNFDKELKRSSKKQLPVGVGHIPFQGDDHRPNGIRGILPPERTAPPTPKTHE